MIIPSDPVARHRLYEETEQQCLATRLKRFQFYQTCRNLALFGTVTDQGVPYNKIGATLETLTSFIYSSDAVRFNLEIGETAPHGDTFKIKPLARELGQAWRTTHTHLRFGQCVYWSLIFGVMLLKVIWRNGLPRTYIVEPHQFGVLREDVTDLADQEAFAMCYTTTLTQLEHDLEGNPRKQSIMARVTAGDSGNRAEFGGGLSRLLLSSPVGGVSGSIARGSAPGPLGLVAGGTPDGGMAAGGTDYTYVPEVAADLVDMVDLYIWNDEARDYQVITRASPGVVIYDRLQERMGVKGLPPFAPVRASALLYNNFWGDSFVAALAMLQNWHADGVANVRLLQGKQADPPISITGAGGIAEEKLMALRSAGGRAAFDMPTAKIDVLRPEMPDNPFAVLQELSNMFDDTAGVGHILQGRGEPGVRSRGQADLMARLGSARPKQRAIVVEESAEDVATLMLRNMQDYSDQRFTAATPESPEPLTFTADQFTNDFEVRVDAHSSSPVFAEDAKAEALTMLENRVIDRATYLEMVRPPNLQLLLERLKVIEAKEEKAAQMKMAAEAAKGGRHAPPQG